MTRRCSPGSIVVVSLALLMMLAGFLVSCENASAPTRPEQTSTTAVIHSGASDTFGASLTTDKADYLPGETVNLTGAGFGASEDVSLVVIHSDGSVYGGENHEPWTVIADENGGFTATWIVCGDDCFGAELLASADGQTSGAHAEAAFTDGLGTAYVASVTPVDGGCVQQTNNNVNSVESWDVQEGRTYQVTLTNVTECSGNTIQVIVKNSEAGNQCLEATYVSEGTYAFQITMPANACNTFPITYCTSNCDANTGYFAHSSINDAKQVHLRAAYFDGNCTKTGNDTDCGGGGTPCQISIACPPDMQFECASEVPAADITLPVVSTTGNCDAVVVTVTETTANWECANRYDVVRTYTATAGDKSATCTQTIHVFDDTLPQLECPGDISVQLMPGDACPAIVTFTVNASDNCGGNVTVVADPPSGSAFPVGTSPVTVTAYDDCGNAATCTFNVVVFSSICATKYYDANVNGVRDGTEIGISSWQINVTGAINTGALTGANGTACFIGLYPGSYTVSETVPGGWIPTTATSYNFDLGCPQEAVFGNVCLGPGGGKTLGFWSNNNGKTQLNDGGTMAPEFALLSALCLVDAAGNPFDPSAYATFRSWLLNATAVNMAYMLSAQLSAMELNVEAGWVSGGSLVYAGSCGNTGVGNQFISINDLIAAAAAALCADGYTPDGDPNRAIQECLKNALDRANNNLNFVQPGPCTSTRASSTLMGM